MVRTNIHLTGKQRDDLKEISEESGLGTAELVRRAIDRFIENYRVYGLTVAGVTGLNGEN